MTGPEAKLFFGWLSVALMLLSRAGYITDIVRGRTRPHMFSWFIWGTISVIGFAAQAVEGAGPGSWARGIGAATCFLLAWAGWAVGERNIKRADWATLAVAMLSLPLWALTKTPFWSVLLVCFIDTIGYIPTVRKSWHRPATEQAVSYLLSCLAAGFSLGAIVEYTPSTWLYPLVLFFSNGTMWALLLLRRRAVRTAAA